MSGGSLAANKRKILEAARKLAQKGAKDKALKEYQKLVKLDPRDAKLRLEIGDAHRRWGQVEEAIETYTKVADQYTKEGFDARAVAVFKQILNLDPNRFESYQPLAELYERMGLTAEAIHALQTAADGFHRQGDKREALDLLRKMATIDPTNTTSRIKVAELLRQEGLGEEAIAEYDYVVEEFERQGDVESSAKVYQRILEVDPNRPQTMMRLARNLLARGGAVQAEPLAQRALEQAGDEPEYYELLADVYRSQSKDAEMSAVYQRLADLYRKRGDDDHARDILQRYVPTGAMAVNGDSGAGLGEASLDAGSLLGSDALPEDELLLESEMIPGVGGDTLSGGLPELETEDLEPGAPADELEIGEEILLEPLVPDAPQVAPSVSPEPVLSESLDAEQLLAEASVYLRYGKRDKAIAHLEKVLAGEPDHRLALEKLGEAYADNGNTEQAVELFLRAVKRAREEGEESAIAVLRGRIAALDEAAAASLDPRPAAPPPEPESVDPEPESLAAEEDESESTLDAELESDEIEIDIDIDVEEEHDEEAAAAPFETPPVPESLPEVSIESASLSSASAQQILEDLEEADFYMQQGLHDEAEVIYKRVLSVAPNHPRALVRLGEVMAARGGDAAAVVEAAAAAPAEIAEADTPPEGVELDAPRAPRRIADETAPELDDEILIEEDEIDLGDGASDLVGLDLDDADDADDAEADPESEVDTAVESSGAEGAAAPQPAQPLASAAPEGFAPAADEAAGGDGFDLAAELSDAFDDSSAGSSFSGGVADDGFSAVFEAFKKGVNETLGEGDHDAHYDLGIAYKEMGLIDDAIQEFRVAMHAPGRRVECLHLIGVCALEAGQPQVAVDHLSQHVDSPELDDEQKLAGRLELGRAYQALGDMARARKCFEAVAASDPDFCGVTEILAALGPAPEPEAAAEEPAEFESFEDVISDALEDDASGEPDPGETFDDLVAEANASVDDDDTGADPASPPASRSGAAASDPAASGSSEPRKKRKKISFV